MQGRLPSPLHKPNLSPTPLQHVQILVLGSSVAGRYNVTKYVQTFTL